MHFKEKKRGVIVECEVCKNEYRIKELEKDSQRNQTTHKEFFARFETLNRQLVGYEKDMSYLTATMTDISKDVKEIKEKPSKRWESIVACALTTVVGAVIGFVMSGILP